MDQALLRAEDVARVLNIGRSKAYELMASGQLPVVRIGRSIRVPAKGFREWLETRVVGTPAAEVVER
jgi:excisionase family DNA binding protein